MKNININDIEASSLYSEHEEKHDDIMMEIYEKTYYYLQSEFEEFT